MANIIADKYHIINQAKERYRIENFALILDRVINTLESQAPEDWRFTISPAARFFVVDFESQVKILGFSYRDAGVEVVKEIQQNIIENKIENLEFDRYINSYLQNLRDPSKKIIHHLRTAYPKTKGEIGEEKRILTTIKSQISHIIPIQEKKFSARPNAIVMTNGKLWVRQHYNWMDMSNPNKEYFLFEQLTYEGINKSQRKIFSYAINGDVKEVCTLKGCPNNYGECFPKIKKDDYLSISFKTDSYWTLPTFLDRRLLDLEFREREPEKAEDGPLNRNEIVELYLLRKIVGEIRKKFM
jgi:hypothetical protein